jgi:hypothetical protein
VPRESRQLRCSLLFSSKLSASGAFSSAETLDLGHYRTEKNSSQPRCFSLFFAVIGCRSHPQIDP